MPISGTSIVYPADLPVPQAAAIQSAERRVLAPGDGLFETRTGQTDRLEFQDVTFPPFSETQALIFDAWWRGDLVKGGCWFDAVWPLPRGWVSAIRRFVAPPAWEFIPSGLWRVTATFEVRGIGEAPMSAPAICGDASVTAAVASTVEEVSMIYLYHADDLTPRPSTMVTNLTPFIRSLGAADGTSSPSHFRITDSFPWSTLPSGDNEAAYFTCTRAGVAPQPPDFTGGSVIDILLTINDIPEHQVGCRVLIFQTLGSWESMAIFINSELLDSGNPAVYDIPLANALSGTTQLRTMQLLDGGTHNPVTGAGAEACTAVVVLRNDYGTLSATYFPIEDY